jgi:two-component sensor histidine kinase
MALVKAVASQTLRGITERNIVTAFSERLLALSIAHDVLHAQNWHAADVGAVVDSTISTFADVARFEISGADVVLGSRAAQSISLLLHELTTNALNTDHCPSKQGP